MPRSSSSSRGLSSSSRGSSSSSRSLSSSSRSLSSSSSRPYSTNIPPPAPKPQTQPIQPVQPVQTQPQSGSFFGSMISGFGFGAGSSIAHRVIGGIGGSSSSSSSTSSSTQPVQQVQQVQPTLTPIVNESKINCRVDCDKFIKEYLQCIESASTDHCSHVFDGYKKECV